MPPPKKLDLMPAEFRQYLAETLQAEGFANIVKVTEDLNFRLEEAGLQLRIGKSAVGEYSALLKNQRDAFTMAETLLGDLDIEHESTMHKVLMQMIATAAFQMMNAVSEKGDEWDPKALAHLSRMLKDLMQSAGIRERLREDERARVAQEAREAAEAEIATRLDTVASEAGMSSDMLSHLRKGVLGLRT